MVTCDSAQQALVSHRRLLSKGARDLTSMPGSLLDCVISSIFATFTLSYSLSCPQSRRLVATHPPELHKATKQWPRAGKLGAHLTEVSVIYFSFT